MIISNGTLKKLRLSVWKDNNEDEQYEAFAYVIALGNALNIPDNENYVITEDEKKE